MNFNTLLIYVLTTPTGCVSQPENQRGYDNYLFTPHGKTLFNTFDLIDEIGNMSFDNQSKLALKN